MDEVSDLINKKQTEVKCKKVLEMFLEREKIILEDMRKSFSASKLVESCLR